MTDAFHAGDWVDDINGSAFGDGFGGAFWETGAAGNAII
jgi:hypothetical protein